MAGGSRKRAEAVFIAAVVAGETIESAAGKAHVSQTTAYRWLRSQGIREEVIRLRSEIIERVAARLTDVASVAVDKLHQLLDAESDAIKLGAVRTILEQLLRIKDHTEIQSRLAELERNVRERKDTES